MTRSAAEAMLFARKNIKRFKELLGEDPAYSNYAAAAEELLRHGIANWKWRGFWMNEWEIKAPLSGREGEW